MPQDLALFLLGLAVTFVVMLGLTPFYLFPYLEQARREGSRVPSPLLWLARAFGLETEDVEPVGEPHRSERTPSTPVAST